ncbi:MAG: AAA family ATPase [Proteobacteria bacterium]|nr:AAA family ATPase [Pseudomonadota bacterium]
MSRTAMTRIEFLKYLLCFPLYVMVSLIVVESLLTATTTWLVIKAGRDVANDAFLVRDLLYILAVQSAAYIIGTISWIYAERAGFRAFGLYMLRFARDNRQQAKLLHDRNAREKVEPFLTSTTFYDIFQLMYELETQLKLLLTLIFNSIVLGSEIDWSLPLAYSTVFAILMTLQWTLRKPVSQAYLENQFQNNRVTAQGYTAWDNVMSGNRYNLRLWIAGFKDKTRDALTAQIKAIMWREGLSTVGGVVGLSIVFATMTYVAIKDAGDTELLIALAATLPRQIEMTNDVHQLSSGWNDVLAVWTRIGGVVESMHPEPDQAFDARIKFDLLTLRQGEEVIHCVSVPEAVGHVFAKATGRINVRGGNGSGKSTLLASLKSELKNRAYYWPTTDRLAFAFAAGEDPVIVGEADDGEDEAPQPMPPKRPGFSSGERQLRSLQEIVGFTAASIYLLDEWDANLDPTNRATADALVQKLANRARVVEISHRDRT